MAQLELASGSQVEVDDLLFQFVRDEVLPGTSWSAEDVFRHLGELVEEFDPPNRALLERRISVQQQIDDYYRGKRAGGWIPSQEGKEDDAAELEEFLIGIGYLQPDSPVDFEMTTPQLDAEMDLNGPELVTPVSNASMAVGGANARWGSLYDAYFLSDVRSEIDRQEQRPARLRMVVEETNAFIDRHVVQWDNANGIGDIGSFSVRQADNGGHELVGHTASGEARLRDPGRFFGFNLKENGDLDEFYLEDNGLRILFQLYDGGKVDEGNGQFRDLFVESAVTNIVDFEDAVAVVDAEDLVASLRNYLGLIRGDLVGFGSRGNRKELNSDRTCTGADGQPRALKSTSLMSVRNVSLHMYTGIVKVDGQEISERMLGLLLTSLIATSHDRGSNGEERPDGSGSMPVRGPNSSRGMVYQVTPKLQTSGEVAEQVRLFEAIESRLGLTPGCILIGIMNEELGMTLQLADALRAAQSRVFFTNTGFLDRTGSQIRAQMHAGPVDLRDDLTQETFNISYERHNVDVSLRAGVNRHGKIGKGMQVRNRAMSEMLERKIDHPRTGGNTAWVPAPYPSDLHATHYHMIDVDEVQRVMLDSPALNIDRVSLLSFPLLKEEKVADPEVKDNLTLRYAHSMVAYVEPWVRRGIGCSGVPNFDQIEEMKDRATERIDGAILANWRLHGVIDQSDVERAILEAAEVVDRQSAGTAGYEPMADTPEKREAILSNPAIVAVLEIIDDALSSPSAYVEPALFRNRLAVKATEN
jgi:malate synthase